MEQDLSFYQRKRRLLQEEIAETDLRIETFEKLNNSELVKSLKKEKLRLESKLQTVIRKEKEFE